MKRLRVDDPLGTLLASPTGRQWGMSLVAHLSESMNLRVQASHFRRRAAAEIARLSAQPTSRPRSLPGLTPTVELLRLDRGAVPSRPSSGAFPRDLPPAR